MHSRAKLLHIGLRLALVSVLLAALAPTVSRALAAFDPRLDGDRCTVTQQGKPTPSVPNAPSHDCPYCLVGNLAAGLPGSATFVPVTPQGHPPLQVFTHPWVQQTEYHWGNPRAPPRLS